MNSARKAKRRVFTPPAFLISGLANARHTGNRLLLSANAAAEALGELVDTATGINDFLLASIERVAFAAHVYKEFAFTHGRSGSEVVAAAAANFHSNIIWMNFWFHDVLPR